MIKDRTMIIADAHISGVNGNADRFFAMLRELETFHGDIVFLGDIFDLWIGWKRYLRPEHFRFLNWCAEQKKVRSGGFIEGNHEFYICRHFSTSFSWCSRESYKMNSMRLEHGDLMNPRDRNYLLFRRLSNHILTSYVFCVLPWGPTLVHYLKRKLKTTNMAYRKHMPEDEINEYANRIFSMLGESSTSLTTQTIVFGHFHTGRHWSHPSGNDLISLPAWLNREEVSLFEDGKLIRTAPWEELLSEAS
jgi:UDP-2,3-diacylglucosamine pyrophosphatase LpxH